MAELRKGYDSQHGPAFLLGGSAEEEKSETSTSEDAGENQGALTFGKGPKVKIDQLSACDDTRDSACWAEVGEWAVVNSSNVAAIAYNKKAQELYVEFLGKGKVNPIYRYSGVSVSTARDMFDSSSVGSFVWKVLRDRYAFQKIKG
jgi:hypothetical protein